MKHTHLARAISLAIALPLCAAAATDKVVTGSVATERAATQNAKAGEAETIEQLQHRVDQLEKTLNERVGAIADEVEAQSQASNSNNDALHIGGYGELHYNNLDADGSETRQLDLHRLVLFVGYDFSDSIRFVSELEVEHTVASGGSRGAVEVEQAYLEFDVKKNMRVKTGLMLLPLGIINETHEPPTFYGVERPVVERTIIPTTWYVGGVSLNHAFDNGLSYDLVVSDGFKTPDPTVDPNADPFDLKQGKQKGSFADAYDLAMTGRVVYRGIAGLEVAGYAQYQPDIDQSAQNSYAESATLMGGHIVYQWRDVTAKALYAHWDLAGAEAAAAGRDLQAGGYAEVSWKPLSRWGFFVRQSAWSQTEGVDAQQTDAGVNFYPHPDVVIKANYQVQNNDAKSVQDIYDGDGFNLGVGYQF